MLAPNGVVVRASDVVVFNNFVLVVDARDGHSKALGFGFSSRGLFYLGSGCCLVPGTSVTGVLGLTCTISALSGTTVRRWNPELLEHRILFHSGRSPSIGAI